ncbi:uncharacterized protein Tco_1221100 [Tanacetum coccineum]
MDTSWMYMKERTSSQFTKGVELFLDLIFLDVGPSSFKKCPCARCGGRIYNTRDLMKDDLIVDGFMENYLPWSLMHNFRQWDDDQNEEVITNIKRDDIVGMVQDALGIPNVVESTDVDEGIIDDETLNYLVGGQTSHARWCLSCFFEALEEIGDGVMPKSYYDANKIVSELGFSYKTWDAYPNDCMLFRGDDKFLDSCRICEASRYKKFNSDKQDDDDNGISKRKIPAKQVCYFPLKPRLKRLFMSPHTASQMTWHAKERVDDGLMRHPADSPAWKMFDKKYLKFRCKIRNVRLGLTSDGFNPFRTMTISHNTLPVILIPYNLLLWLCMKQPSFILSILIDGPKAPGDKIDVYLQLLIDELKDTWRDGVSTYDASTKSMFQLHDALLWTISDFPAYAKLSGTAGKTKDHLNARLDLKELNIRPSLHLQETNSSRILLPPACFTLGKDEKYQFVVEGT